MPQLFTLVTANALVPELTELFLRLREIRERGHSTRQMLATVEQKGKSNGKDLASELRELQQRLEALGTEADGILQRITATGCELKDVEQGLVDFPADRDGRVIYLCWKLGEDRIHFWHEIAAGFAGRQPL
jgi:hypothetical protein